MKSTLNSPVSEELAQRKGEHIELAARAQTSDKEVDSRFNYEPLFFTHPAFHETWPTTFLNSQLDFPLWISSMTGGTGHARTINQNLAKLCGEYKLGMGLGSCRSLLSGNERLEDFKVRSFMQDQPLYANLGLAQLEELVVQDKVDLVHEMVKNIEATGLIIHLNPLQEWFQPEGDRYKISPLLTLRKFLETTSYPVIIKEVGQGMGPRSLKALLELPIAGIEFGAFGGTNFSLLESLRSNGDEEKRPLIQVGHTAHEMVEILNALPTRNKEFIISGGIKNVLDGYELKMKMKAPAVIGMASAFLNPALESYEVLEKYFLNLKESLLTAKGILTLKGEM
jgi:isopentenyl-diphosphate delta-isomerase